VAGSTDNNAGTVASFRTTHWSVVLNAGRDERGAANEALESLCKAYWYPLYAFARRQGREPEDAQDLTQEFFARFLERDSFALASPERGRFRSFLLTCFKRFAAESWRKATRLKRGGRVAAISLDAADAEGRYSMEPKEEQSPDRLFERRWAETLLERAVGRLRQDYESTGRTAVYMQLQQFLWGREASLSYAEMGERLGMAEGAVKVAVHRLRQRFRDILHEEVANTVASPEDVADELRHLMTVFAK
jgi:RNA polymerase sigma factor (sigma-70 family)